MATNQALIEKLNSLPAARLHEVEDFVDFLRSRDQDRALSRAIQTISEPAFSAIWDNPENSVYDAL